MRRKRIKKPVPIPALVAPPGPTLKEVRETTDAFHKLFYPLHFTTKWMGNDLQKCPMDLLIYQEILWENRPDLLIECGTFKGASALFFAHMMDLLQRGTVLTIDLNRWAGFPIHPRVMYLTGSTTEEVTFKKVKEIAAGYRNIMVILDSDHQKDHVVKELDLYADLVTRAQYLVVEDTDVHGHPVCVEHPPGPWEAIEEWLPKHDEFYQDRVCERFLMTMHPGGWLRKVK